MAEEQDQERRLPTSQKHLDDACAHGQVPRLRDLTTAVLMGAAAVFAAGGPLMTQASADFLGGALLARLAAAARAWHLDEYKLPETGGVE